MKNDNLPLVLYGAGNNAKKEKIVDKLSELNPVCFCDVDKEKQGSPYLGLPVFSLKEIREKYGNAFLLYLTMGQPLKSYVTDFLLANGIDKEQITNYEDDFRDSSVPLIHILNNDRTKEWMSMIPSMLSFNEMGFTLNNNLHFKTIEGEQVITMMSIFEATYLYCIAKYEFEGKGVIVDLGPFGGMSTYSLLRGVRANSRIDLGSTPTVYSFDLFLTRGYEFSVDANMDSGTGSVFMKYLRTVMQYIEYLHITPGDLLNVSWCNRDIEILFIDVCKTWETNDCVVKTFFPYLVPGKSLVMQQDYLYFGHHWIHLTMEILKDYFVVEEYIPYNSVVFRCVKPLPESLKDFNLRSMYSIDELLDLHWQVVSNSPDEVMGIMILSHAYFLYTLGMIDRSKKCYEVFEKKVEISKDEELQKSFDMQMSNMIKHYFDIVEY